MFRLLLILLLLSLSTAWTQEFVCAPSVPTQFDPHQSLFPLEKEISKALYLPLLPAEKESPAVAQKWVAKDKTWILTLKSGLQFNPSQGWKGTRPLTADDVNFSLSRQLKRSGKTLYEERTYLPAKLSGLEKHLAQMKVVSPTVIELTFKKVVSEDELKRLLAPPVGIILSKEFHDLRARKPGSKHFFPTSSQLNFFRLATGEISLLPQTQMNNLTIKKGSLIYKQAGLSADLKQAQCSKYFYPTRELVQKNPTFKKEAISRTRLSLLINPGLGLSDDALLSLQQKLTQTSLPSLRGYPNLRSIFGTKDLSFFPPKSALKKTPERELQIHYCEAETLPEISMPELVGEISKSMGKELNMRLKAVRADCSLIHSYAKNSQVAATISAVNYKDETELISLFSCDADKQVFGFCSASVGKSKEDLKKAIDVEHYKFKHLIPLVDKEDLVLKL